MKGFEVTVVNHQEVVGISEGFCRGLEGLGGEIARDILEGVPKEGSVLGGLGVIEVSLVEREVSARVHREFMGVDGATDVITFAHGEIVICAEVAEEQAREYGEPVEREVLRYFIHGVLHLAGFDDQHFVERQTMERAQEMLVATFWDEEFDRLMWDPG